MGMKVSEVYYVPPVFFYESYVKPMLYLDICFVPVCHQFCHANMASKYQTNIGIVNMFKIILNLLFKLFN
jgi:hypothetical protein